MTAEQLEELLGKVTPGEWEEVTPDGGIWPPRVFSGTKIVCMVDNSDVVHEERHANATLIAMAPDLARRVIAAERLVEAAERVLLARPGSLSDAEYRLDLDTALTAYREASKGATPQ